MNIDSLFKKEPQKCSGVRQAKKVPYLLFSTHVSCKPFRSSIKMRHSNQQYYFWCGQILLLEAHNSCQVLALLEKNNIYMVFFVSVEKRSIF